MKFIKNTTDFSVSEETVISLGKFDGIHRGHARLMEYLRDKKKAGFKTVVFTFDIPPSRKVGGRQQPKVLTTNEEKMQLFGQEGIDYLIECPFTETIMRMEPEDFVEMIVRKLHVKSMVVGEDFRFGHKRKGDYRLLGELSKHFGYEVQVIKKVRQEGRDISSTFVREEISAGRIEKANHLLGYPYFVQGEVVHGNEIGRKIHVPTANLIVPEDKLLPPFGVYITRTRIGTSGKWYEGITNVGCKPTIEGENPVGVETHLFHFDGQLYGMKIQVQFLSMVRREKKFASLEELKKQLTADLAQGEEYFAHSHNIVI